MLGLHFTPACVLLSVCSLHFAHSLHFTPGPQSAVRSLRFTLTVFSTVACNATPARHVRYVNITPFPRNVSLGRLWCHCNPDRDKFSSLSNTTVMAIFVYVDVV